MTERIYTAAILVIGNEILSGRTQDKNTNHIANKLNECGIRLMEARTVPDIESMIVHAVNRLRVQYDYVFTTGGIGPTHDDITAASVAKAFETPLEQNEEAYNILASHYTKEELTPPRLKMAQIPVGAKLVSNPVSGAPGFNIGNVYVMAGVPNIMQSMLDSILPNLKGGPVVLSKTVEAKCGESKIAEGLSKIQDKYTEIDIGSYPQYKDGVHATSIVMRCENEKMLDKAAAEVQALIESIGA